MIGTYIYCRSQGVGAIDTQLQALSLPTVTKLPPLTQLPHLPAIQVPKRPREIPHLRYLPLIGNSKYDDKTHPDTGRHQDPVHTHHVTQDPVHTHHVTQDPVHAHHEDQGVDDGNRDGGDLKINIRVSPPITTNETIEADDQENDFDDFWMT